MKKNTLIKNIILLIVGILLIPILGTIAVNAGIMDDMEEIVGIINFDLSTILYCFIAVAFVVAISNAIIFILKLVGSKGGRMGTLSSVFSSLIKYVAVIGGGCWVLSLIGVNVSTIFASLGIVALVLGFGAESLIADVVTGVFILFENQYNIGDIIEVDGFRGTVSKISIRTLSLTDTGGNIKIINNSSLVNIINRSNQRSVAVTDISVSYEADLEKIEAQLVTILAQIKEKNSNVFSGRVEYVGVEALADSGVVLRFIADVEEDKIYSGRRLLNRELKIAFDKHNISIPYPQVDVHTK
jgi:small conductance mechanosensitive channel